MKIEVDDRYTNMMVDAIDALLKNYDAYGYKMTDVPDIARIGIAFKQRVEQLIAEADDDEAKFNKEHPEFSRSPGPGEKMVLGKGYVKDDEKK